MLQRAKVQMKTMYQEHQDLLKVLHLFYKISLLTSLHHFHLIQQIFFYQVHTMLEFDAPTIAVLKYTMVQYLSLIHI